MVLHTLMIVISVGQKRCWQNEACMQEFAVQYDSRWKHSTMCMIAFHTNELMVLLWLDKIILITYCAHDQIPK